MLLAALKSTRDCSREPSGGYARMDDKPPGSLDSGTEMPHVPIKKKALSCRYLARLAMRNLTDVTVQRFVQSTTKCCLSNTAPDGQQRTIPKQLRYR